MMKRTRQDQHPSDDKRRKVDEQQDTDRDYTPRPHLDTARDRHQESAGDQHRTSKGGRTFRVRGVPLDWDITRLQSFLADHDESTCPIVRSLAHEIHGRSRTATVKFQNDHHPLQTAQARHSWQIALPADSTQSAPCPQNLTLDDGFLGITTLHAPLPEHHKADIVAISGLGGHAFGSFKERGGEHMWLRDALPYHITGENDNNSLARVMVCGHDSSLLQSESIQNLEDLGTSLHSSLLALARAATPRPIIFIAHSLGGLIVKQTLISLSKSHCEDDRKLIQSVYGIVFFGVPHNGMDISSLIPMVGDGPNRFLLECLGANNSQIISIQQREFNKALGGKGESEIVCFYETHKSPTAIKDEKSGWQMRGPPAVLVTKSSATHGRSWENGTEHICAVNRTHSEMIKFGSEDEEYYKALHRIQGLIQRALAAPSRNQGSGANTTRNSLESLSGLHRLASYFPQYPYHQAETADSLDSQDLAWFFESPEFTHWDCHDSEFLWLSGIPNSGKTILSFCLWDQLRRNRTYNRRQDIAIYFCSSAGNINMHQTPESQMAQILSTLIIQLLRSDQERQECVAKRCRLLELPKQLIAFSPSQSFLDDLWDIFSTSVTALPSRQVIIIIDAIDALRTEGSRQNFLKNLLQLRTEVSKKGTGFKIFVTSKPFDDIKKELSEVPSIEKDKERQECLRTLKFDEFSGRRDRVGIAHSGTGKWLGDDVAYTNWDSSNSSSLLLICGKPGSGKSTLAKSILDSKRSKYAFTQSSSDEVARAGKDVLIADFFYSFRGGKKETNHTLMLQSLLYQLLNEDERLFPLFRDVYRARRMDPNFKWQHEDLRKIFASLPSLKTRQKIYILLDAMDESTKQGRPEILGLLSDLCSSESSCNFKCLIASRPLPAGEVDETRSRWHTIRLQEKSREDIEKVITHGLRDIEKHFGESVIDFQSTREYMMRYAQGVFLWVTLVLKELKELALVGTSPEELERRLKDLPLDLEEMYNLIIQRLVDHPKSHPDMIIQGSKMLTWVTFAERPLRMEEFRDAIAIPSMSVPGPFKPEPGLLEKRRIQGLDRRIAACCGPLLEVRLSVVQLLHLTVREYLLREDRPAKPFDTDEERGDTEIASGCIRYLRLLSLQSSTGDVGSWSPTDYDDFVKRLAGYPLLEYVVSFLPNHLKTLVKDLPVFSDLSMFLQALGKDHAISLLFDSWAKQLPNKSGPTDRQPGIEPEQFRTKCLIAAAQNGYTYVVDAVIKLHTDINGVDQSGIFALLAAANNGHEAVVRLLLEKGGAVNVRGVAGQTPLSSAAEQGREAIVQLLLENGADVDVKDDSSRTPLSCAAEQGRKAIIKLLLEHGSDVNARDNSSRTPLWWAARQGHKVVIQLLLNSGAVINMTDNSGWTPLLCAAEQGRKTVIKLLLDYGSDVNAKDDSGWTPLWWAAEQGHEAVVQLLLEGGADINVKDMLSQTPLWWAARQGHEAVVQLLLNSGADINVTDNSGRTPLWWAAEQGHEAVVQLLLEGGADIKVKDQFSQTPLIWAAGQGHKSIVQLLLEKGADIDVKDQFSQTPLIWAAEQGRKAIVQLLLEKGATVDTKDAYGRTPLLWAAEKGHKAIVQLLQRHLQ